MLRGLLRVAGFEYSRIVFRKRFLLVLLSPVLVILAMGAAMLAMIFSLISSEPVGIVDLTGSLQPPASLDENSPLDTQMEVLVFPDEESNPHRAIAAGFLIGLESGLRAVEQIRNINLGA